LTLAGTGEVSDADRAALLGKYRQLAEWRRMRDGGTAVSSDRKALRALSVAFPGALRELDVLGLAELVRRMEVLAAGRASDEPWLSWILAYHRLMRAALCAKQAAGRTRPLSETARTAALAAAQAVVKGELLGGLVDEEFASAAAQPAGGRLAVVVLRTLSRHFGVPAARISATLFPSRRPAPYVL
jgi:hypothetical protein